MSFIKMKKNKYADETAIYDVVKYCLDHDLANYCVTYLPMRYDFLRLDAGQQLNEISYITAFWNTFLNIHCKNWGRRCYHFVISLYDKKMKLYENYAELVISSLGELASELQFPSIAAYHINEYGNHHIHFVIGVINIKGENWYSKNISVLRIANYLRNRTGKEFYVAPDEWMEL